MEEVNSEFEQVALHEMDIERESLLDGESQSGSDVEQDFELEENVEDDEMEATDGTNALTARSAGGIGGDQIEENIDYKMVFLTLICVVLIERIIMGNVMSDIYNYISELKFKLIATLVLCVVCLTKAMCVYWREEYEYYEDDGRMYGIEEVDDFYLQYGHHLDGPVDLLEGLPEDVPRPAERGSSERDGQNE